MKTLYIIIFGYVIYFIVMIVKDLFFSEDKTSKVSSKIVFEQHKPKKINKPKDIDLSPQEALEKSEAPDFNQEFFYTSLLEEKEADKLVAEIEEENKLIEKKNKSKSRDSLKKEKESLVEKASFLENFRTDSIDTKSIVADEIQELLNRVIENPDLITVELN